MAKLSKTTIDAVKSVPIVDLAAALGDNPNRVGKQYRVNCPNPSHSERTPDTYIESNKNIFKCFGSGGCGAGGNGAIAYFDWHEHGESNTKNFVKCVEGIADLMGIPIEYENGQVRKPRESFVYKPREIAEEIPAADVNICDKVYRAFLKLCPVRKEHAEEWLGKRRYTAEEVKNIGLKSVPDSNQLPAVLSKMVSLKYPIKNVPGFVQRFVSNSYHFDYPENLIERDEERGGVWYWTISAGPGYFIPVRDEMGRIVRMRIRMESGKAKYIWFSSSDNIATEKERKFLRKGGASSGAPLNIVPPASQIKHWEPGTDLSDLFGVHTVLATEGEHKSQISANKLKIVTVGIPGVGNFEAILPLLEKWGTKRLIIAYDMDSLNKKEDFTLKEKKKQENIFKKLLEFANRALALGIEVLIWTWDINHGKGLDDLLLTGRLPLQINLRTQEKRPVRLEDLRALAG